MRADRREIPAEQTKKIEMKMAYIFIVCEITKTSPVDQAARAGAHRGTFQCMWI